MQYWNIENGRGQVRDEKDFRIENKQNKADTADFYTTKTAAVKWETKNNKIFD